MLLHHLALAVETFPIVEAPLASIAVTPPDSYPYNSCNGTCGNCSDFFGSCAPGTV